MLYKFLQFKVRPLLRLIMFPFKKLEPLFSYPSYQSLTQLMKMFCIETVIIATFGHAIIFVKPCGVTSTAEIMRAVSLLKWKYSPASGAFEVFEPVFLAIPQPYVAAERFIGLSDKVGLLLDLNPRFLEERQGLVFLLLSSEVVRHPVIFIRL